MTAQIETFYHNDTFTLTHVIHDGPGTEAAIIDSALDYNPANGRLGTEAADELLAYLGENDLKLLYILDTHVHADHLTAARYLRHQTGAKVGMSKNLSVVQESWSARYNVPLDTVVGETALDLALEDGDELQLNGNVLGVMATPGHTPTCLTYTYADAAFVGDTFFMPDYGTARCDFPGGDSAELYRSLQKTLSLPDETRLFICHDYCPGGRELKWVATVAEQRETNINLVAHPTEADYAAFRAEKDAGLAAPRLLLPAIQVNMRGGALPAAEDNGARYLKIPIGGDHSTWT